MGTNKNAYDVLDPPARPRMTKSDWTPKLAADGPRYRALADAIAEAVHDGVLAAGERLPAVRDLAWRLEVTPGTVARAYQLAESRGLVEGKVGSGTYVLDSTPDRDRINPTNVSTFVRPGREEPEGAIEMRLNRAADIGQDAILTAALERLIAARRPLPLTDYHRYGEDIEERAAGVDWLKGGGVPARVEDVVICSGAQHGMLTALAATCGGGDAIALTEPLIHPGLKDSARGLGLRLEPVAVDREGLLPDALDEACRRHRPGAIILTAVNQNPSLATMSDKRREAIAEVARRRRVPIVEDDVYGWLVARRRPSFPSLCPELSWYVTSLSKCVAAGLRVGYVLAPPGEGPRAARLLQGYTQHVSWLISALAAEVIRSGDAARIVEEVRLETARRTVAVEAAMTPALQAGLGKLTLSRSSTMGWLELPEPWRAMEFVEAARRAGVLVSPAEAFAVGRSPAPHAVRLAFSNIPTRSLVAEGARRLADLLVNGPSMHAIQDLRA